VGIDGQLHQDQRGNGPVQDDLRARIGLRLRHRSLPKLLAMELGRGAGVPPRADLRGCMQQGQRRSVIMYRIAPSAGAPLLAGCVSEQSMLHPAGEDAAAVANLFWVMAAGTVVIWLVVMGITLYAVLGKKRPKTERFADRFILIGGVAFPSITLAALLIFGLA